MLPWIFFIVMSFPSFGGPVLARVQMTNETSCRDFRKMIIKQLKDLQFNYEVTECVVKPSMEN